MKKDKAVVTILGFSKIIEDYNNRADYYFEEKLNINSLKKEKYTNMFPLLIDNFSSEHDIIPIYTKLAKDKNIEVLESENIEFDNFRHKFFIEENEEYNTTFKKINEAINSDYGEIILDVSHGFRHLPMLSIISTIVNSISDSEKIKHIFFTKEIEREKKYQIIDLIEYLDIAKMSFVLNNFNKNYTIGNKFYFNDESYDELVFELGDFSRHILSNSIKFILETNEPLIDNIIKTISKFQTSDERVKTFSKDLQRIKEHLIEIQKLKDKNKYVQFLELSKIMKDRDYLLNSVTLLNESIGLHCSEVIKSLDKKIENHISEYLDQEKSNLYELASNAKNIIKHGNKFSGSFLFNKDKKTSGQKTSEQNKKSKLKDKIPVNILNEINNSGYQVSLELIDNKTVDTIKDLVIKKIENKDFSKLKSLIIAVDALRNDLAHGNTNKVFENVKQEIYNNIKEFDQIINEK
jgi:CRISPR-associated DxTHG motif protein